MDGVKPADPRFLEGLHDGAAEGNMRHDEPLPLPTHAQVVEEQLLAGDLAMAVGLEVFLGVAEELFELLGHRVRLGSVGGFEGAVVAHAFQPLLVVGRIRVARQALVVVLLVPAGPQPPADERGEHLDNYAAEGALVRICLVMLVHFWLPLVVAVAAVEFPE